MKKQSWTDEKRTAQAARLSKALQHERSAIAEIGNALRTVTADDGKAE